MGMCWKGKGPLGNAGLSFQLPASQMLKGASWLVWDSKQKSRFSGKVSWLQAQRTHEKEVEPEEAQWVLTRVSMAIQRVRAAWRNVFSPSRSLEEGSKQHTWETLFLKIKLKSQKLFSLKHMV